VGVLVAAGALNFVSVAVGAALGTVLGGTTAYFIGRFFRDRLRTTWVFTRFPHWVERAETFFERHGGKGILFGRYTKPLRLMLPAVAGIMGMPPRRFLPINLISGVLWAPLYISVGIFGARVARWASDDPRRVALVIAVVLILAASAVVLRRRQRRA
jgi:membrane protein DedA with SNARE-associated domain